MLAGFLVLDNYGMQHAIIANRRETLEDACNAWYRFAAPAPVGGPVTAGTEAWVTCTLSFAGVESVPPSQPNRNAPLSRSVGPAMLSPAE
jgi:hypothetical protein